MKKLVSLILALAMVLCAVSFASADETYRVAMITDSGDITDQSFNQTTYEACKAFCEANGVDFNYFKPTGDSDAERIAQVEAAIDEGYNVIVMPGYLFAAAIGECQPTYPDVKFIALDVSEYDLTSNGVDLSKASNLFSAVYQEELSGYMAGYAAVKMGYKKLGFLGGMEVPAVQRFGYGFVQDMATMTVEELAALPGVHVGTKEAAAVLGCDRYSLNIAAKQGTLNIPHMFVGNRLKISKAALLEYCGYIKREEAPLSIVFSKGVKMREERNGTAHE